MKKKIETRETNINSDTTGTKFVGSAAVYNVQSKYGLTNDYVTQPFKEMFLPGCFADSIATGRDVLALSDHIAVSATLLGRLSNNTLRLNDTPEALGFEIDIPSTQQGEDIKTQIQRGDITGVSLGMIVIDDEYVTDTDGLMLRIVKKAMLQEISLVINPAYSQTKVEVREMKQEVPVDNMEVEEAEIEILKIKFIVTE